MEFNATFIVAAVSFIAFTLLMEAIFYAPISNIIAKRKAYFNKNTAITNDNITSAQKIKENKEKDVLAKKTEAKNEIMSAVDNANSEKAEKEQTLKDEMIRNISEKKVALNNEKESTSNEMKAQLDDISNSILAKLTGGNN